MNEDNPVNQGSLDKQKLEQLGNALENIENKPAQEKPLQPTQPVRQPSEPQPVSPTVSTDPKPQGLGKSKGILWIGIALLVLALVGIGAYFLGSRKNATTVTPEPVSTQTPTPTPDSTANWKIYTNEETGYSVKYPSDRYLRLICPDEELTLVSNELSLKEQPNPVEMPTCARSARYALEIVTHSIPPEKPGTDQYYSVIKKDILVGDVEAERYTFSLITTEPGEGYVKWYTQVIIEHNDKTYWIYFGSEEQVNVFDQILSTFKFIEVTPSATTTP